MLKKLKLQNARRKLISTINEAPSTGLVSAYIRKARKEHGSDVLKHKGVVDAVCNNKYVKNIPAEGAGSVRTLYQEAYGMNMERVYKEANDAGLLTKAAISILVTDENDLSLEANLPSSITESEHFKDELRERAENRKDEKKLKTEAGFGRTPNMDGIKSANPEDGIVEKPKNLATSEKPVTFKHNI